LQSSFHQWERISSDSGEQVRLTKELLAACESIEWQVLKFIIMCLGLFLLKISVLFYGLICGVETLQLHEFG
jgi:hypothetical protein